MLESQQDSSGFTLKPGERITECCPLWTSASDRMLEEVANCNFCLLPTYRILVITSAAGLERRVALCASHFDSAAKTFPDLHKQSA